MKNKVVAIIGVILVICVIGSVIYANNKNKELASDDINTVETSANAEVEDVEEEDTDSEDVAVEEVASEDVIEDNTEEIDVSEDSEETENISYTEVNTGYNYDHIKIVTDGTKNYVLSELDGKVYEYVDQGDGKIFISVGSNGGGMYYSPKVEDVEVGYTDISDYDILCRFYVECDYQEIAKTINSLFSSDDFTECEITKIEDNVCSICFNKFFYYTLNLETNEVVEQ
jgi:hypothetical protein